MVSGIPTTGDLWGGVRPDLLSVSETPDAAAAMAAAEAADTSYRDAASGRPGVGGQVMLPDPPSGIGGYGMLPVVGEGYGTPAPAQPAQVAADHGEMGAAGRPAYASPPAGDEDPFLGGQ